MASKKIKPVMNNFNTVETTESGKVVTENNNTADTTIEKIESVKPLTSGEFSDEIKQKLESIEKLQNENVKLISEKSELEQHIAEYIQQIAKMQAKMAEMQTMITKQNDMASAVYLNEINELKTKIVEMQAESDKYLMKISDLTFENAKKTSEIQELNNKINIKPVTTFTAAAPHPSENSQKVQQKTFCQGFNVYRNGGYQDWN